MHWMTSLNYDERDGIILKLLIIPLNSEQWEKKNKINCHQMHQARNWDS